MIPLLAAIAAFQQAPIPFVDYAITRERALNAERLLDWQTAFNDWERILDRTDATVEQRTEAAAHVHDLNTKVTVANTDPSKAKPWPVLVVLFRQMDVSWKDKKGGSHHFSSEMHDADQGLIFRAFETFQNYVFRYTGGLLKVVPTKMVVDEPVKEIDGDGTFWVSPQKLHDRIIKLMGGKKFQSVFVYLEVKDGVEELPAAFSGGTFGADQNLDGAAFSEVLWNQSRPTDGEVELHEWLHEIDWMFTNVLGYPQAASINPDTGRKIGEEGGDLDYRRPKSDLNWMDFYIHIMQDHITRQMWREATMWDPAANPWLEKRGSTGASGAESGN